VSFPGRGIPEVVEQLAHEVEFNDIESLETAMAQHGSRVAAIILEPVMLAGGVIEADPEYLVAARRLADAHGALLVIDEIVTLRFAWSGQQSVSGIRPDLTTFGKIIGGGLPVGAVGGRADVLSVYDPRTEGHIVHSGTFNGNSMSLAAGVVSLDLLTAPEIERINALGDRLAEGLRRAAPEAVVTSVGSCVQIHFGVSEPLRRYRDTNMGHPQLARFHRAALERGVFLAARGMLNTSTAMDESVIGEALERLADAAVAARDEDHR
jgi:glutamate-1-semialdehyde 2,1-aminomutase